MAVRVYCVDPSALLNQIKLRLREGGIDTWEVDSDGDFTHSPPQWKNKAWFRPRIEAGRIVFRILAPKATQISRSVYGVYHGRLIEMLVTHFDASFSTAEATALAVSGVDIVVG